MMRRRGCPAPSFSGTPLGGCSHRLDSPGLATVRVPGLLLLRAVLKPPPPPPLRLRLLGVLLLAPCVASCALLRAAVRLPWLGVCRAASLGVAGSGVGVLREALVAAGAEEARAVMLVDALAGPPKANACEDCMECH